MPETLDLTAPTTHSNTREVLAALLTQHTRPFVLAFLVIELVLMGFPFAPLGALLPELFPTAVRYTGAASAYSLGGILGGSLAPYIAQRLVSTGGLPWVGYYITGAGIVSFLAVLAIRETRQTDLNRLGKRQ